MERTPFGIAQLDVHDDGYLPGGGESADLSESLTVTEWPYDRGGSYEDPEQNRDRIDASVFAAMLHP
jgi:hypothetical protein